MSERSSKDWEDHRSGRPILGAISTRMDRILSQWSENGSQIEKPLKAVFITFLTIAVLALTAQNIVAEYRALTAPHNRIAIAATNLLREHKDLGTHELNRIVNALGENEEFQSAILSGVEHQIADIVDTVIAHEGQNVKISEFTIYSSNRRILYRAFGNQLLVSSETAFESDLASTLFRTPNSLEFGDNDEVVVSIFRPWIADGHLRGYVKLAVDIEHPLALAGAAVDVEIIKVNGTFHPATRAISLAKMDPANVHFRYKAMGPAKASPSAVETILRRSISPDGTWPFHLDGNRILISQDLPNEIANGGPTAKLVLVRDVTAEVITFAKNTFLVLLAGIGLALIAWLIFKRLLTTLQNGIRITRSRLEATVLASTKQLELGRAKLLEAQKIASVGSWERDIGTNEVYASDEFIRIMSVPSGTPPTKIQDELFSRIPQRDLVNAKRSVDTAIETCGDFDFEHAIVRGDGSIATVHVRGYVVPDSFGNPLRVIGTAHDITDRRHAERQDKLLASILATSLHEIFIVDKETLAFEYANACALANLGYTLDELKSQKFWDIDSSGSKEAVELQFEPLLHGTATNLTFESAHKRKDGSLYPIDLQIQALNDRGRKLFVGIATDISERLERENETRAAKERAELLAYFDPLTKLLNRAGCQRDANQRFTYKEKPAFLIHVDMDNFKRVNDTLGHLGGDYCLEETGRRLREVSRGLGTPYRWGGDEFVILADKANSDPNEICERARRIMRQPMEFNGTKFWPTVSMGIAICPENGNDFDTLLVNADLALYQSKDGGKDRFTFFTSDMKAESAEEAHLELELQRAVKNDEFFLEFQPQVNLRNQKVTGVEALVRWNHPERGIVPPGQFLNVVEKTGLAPVLGKIVIDKALAAAKSWQDAALDFGRISVNVSPAHLASGQLIDHFRNAMSSTGITPDLVTAEVLESVFLDDKRTGHLTTLTTLNQLGVHIELDDFGTGYASLTHVADLPINGLKIDRSFTNQMLEDRKKEVVVNQLIHLARALDIGVVCEGVETEEEYDLLRMMGDFSIQGYLIARPMPLDRITDWMSEAADDLYYVM